MSQTQWMKDTTNPSPSQRPSHAVARAFFDALDQRSFKDKQNKKSRCSPFVLKQLTTLGWRNRYSQNEYYRVSVRDTNFSILQIQRGEIDDTYGTGACVWPAAVVLLKYLEHQSGLNLVKNCNVVDLGSGTAITSVAAAVLGAKQVICTDGCEKVVQLAKSNIEGAAKQITDASTNEERTLIRGCNMITQVLWWGRDSIQSSETDVVIVADCLLPKLYPIPPLVQAIDELLIKPEALAVISYEHRYYPRYDPREKFRELANLKGLTVQMVPHVEHHPIYNVDDIEIWKVYRRVVENRTQT